MKKNDWVKNTIYLILIVVLFWGGTAILSNHSKEIQMYYRPNLVLIILTKLTFFGGVGVVLGLDNFIVQLKKEGNLKFNIPKLVVIGLPSLILSIPYLWAAFVPFAMPFLDPISLASSIVLGYTFVSSIFKENLSNE